MPRRRIAGSRRRLGEQVRPVGFGLEYRARARVRDGGQLLIDAQVLACFNEHDFRRSEEHTSELQSLMRISYAVFCLKKKKINKQTNKSLNTTETSNVTTSLTTTYPHQTLQSKKTEHLKTYNK